MPEELHFGDLLRRLRTDAGFTQEEVAERARLSARAIGDLERGTARRPQRKTVESLIAALELDDEDARLLAAARRRPTRPVPSVPPLPSADPGGTVEERGSSANAAESVPRQLPAGPWSFVARSGELAELDRIGGGQIVAVIGAGGIGKTALAVAWAHHAAERFPDGQLFVDLRGFDPRGRSLPAHEALGGFLQALGVAVRQLPESTADRAALYRTLVADRRLLVVLDNAVDSEHVRPLLPAGPGCRTVVTSRDRLTGLVAVEGARPVRLGPLADADACLLLTSRLRHDGADPEPPDVKDLIRYCGGLPLAVTILAARLTLEPDVTVSDLARRLADEKARLDELGVSDAAADTRAVISWSVRNLDPQTSAVFRSLGLHPTAEFSLEAATSLAGLPSPATRRALRELVDANLLEPTADGRWRSHDLIRLYAVELADAELDAAAIGKARCRMLDHYLHTAFQADRLVHPLRAPITLGPAAPGATVTAFDDDTQALRWLRRESATVTVVVDLAVAHGHDAHACQVPWTLLNHLDDNADWPALILLAEHAIAAARRLGDPRAEAQASGDAAVAHYRRGDHDAGLAALERARILFTELDDKRALARIERITALIYESMGRYDDEAEHAGRALELAQAVGSPTVEANGHAELAKAEALRGGYETALRHARAAAELFRQLGDRNGEGDVLGIMGLVAYRRGRRESALDYYQQCEYAHADAGTHFDRFQAIARVSALHAELGDTEAAEQRMRDAERLAGELGLRPDEAVATALDVLVRFVP
ncbi:helix-turn-helix domain-containing protein [Catenulispora sp. GAS73]|uniref:ATP-binding protein n=1 Tax=Catenulispora sp. GAS73 TaxID=3156269 RepID=UPI0035127204